MIHFHFMRRQRSIMAGQAGPQTRKKARKARDGQGTGPSPAPGMVDFQVWGCWKEREAGKVLPHVCRMLQLCPDDLKTVEEAFFWNAAQFRNVPMVHAFGLVVRLFAEDLSCWRRLRNLCKNCRVMAYVLALYVAMKQMTGDPKPSDVLETLGRFGMEVSIEQVNMLEVSFLTELRWRTHLTGNPDPASPDAQLVVKSECKYNMLLQQLPSLVDDSGNVQWTSVQALSRQLA